MQPVNMLNNIPLDPIVRRGLEENQNRPLFPNFMSKLFGFLELVVCFFVSMSPNWNIDAYIKVVYHYVFRNAVRDRVLAMDAAEQVRLHEEEIEKRRLLEEPNEIQEVSRHNIAEDDALDGVDGPIIQELPIDRHRVHQADVLLQPQQAPQHDDAQSKDTEQVKHHDKEE